MCLCVFRNTLDDKAKRKAHLKHGQIKTMVAMGRLHEGKNAMPVILGVKEAIAQRGHIFGSLHSTAHLVCCSQKFHPKWKEQIYSN